jgi:hypothetical protein
MLAFACKPALYQVFAVEAGLVTHTRFDSELQGDFASGIRLHPRSRQIFRGMNSQLSMPPTI